MAKKPRRGKKDPSSFMGWVKAFFSYSYDSFEALGTIGYNIFRRRPVLLLGEEFTAAAKPYDGDTLEITRGGKPTTVRIWGIDAPELKQMCVHDGKQVSCGILSRDFLIALIGDKPVTVMVRDHDRYGRAVAVCRAGEKDIGEELVREGLAFEYKEFTKGRYGAAENAAREAKRGVWSMDTERPEDWREKNMPQRRRKPSP